MFENFEIIENLAKSSHVDVLHVMKYDLKASHDKSHDVRAQDASHGKTYDVGVQEASHVMNLFVGNPHVMIHDVTKPPDVKMFKIVQILKNKVLGNLAILDFLEDLGYLTQPRIALLPDICYA